MAELLLELLSEEIPARLQANAARDLHALLTTALAPLSPTIETHYGPRRIAAVAQLSAELPATTRTERGPRATAPEAALAGFLRKHNATRDQIAAEGDYWMLTQATPARPAQALIAESLPGLLRRFPWPKSMRWGGASAFTWIRPLRRILCILNGEIVPFDLRQGDDDGHNLASANLTEGHPFLSPGAFPVASAAHWRQELRTRHVIVDATERRTLISQNLAAAAARHNLTIVEDGPLLDEVANLVEWPVPLLGRIDPAFMDLPAEVMQVSMRVNQRYFALRQSSGEPAPWFGFVANIVATDHGAAIIAGNERVLRARFSDARHFWDLDRRTRLADRIAALDAISFHAKLGNQGARVRRMAALAEHFALACGAQRSHADRAALLAKADLTTAMVGEFPELQGVIGSYYARHDDEPAEIVSAIRDHYAPRGPHDPCPQAPVSIVVALADKLDTLAGFFSVGERPTGSGDPFALRRAALGVLRLIRENNLPLHLPDLIHAAAALQAATADEAELLAFMMERLRVQLRSEGARHDVVDAVFAVSHQLALNDLLRRAASVAALLTETNGGDLLAGYKRADNILRIESLRDGPHNGLPNSTLFTEHDERTLHTALQFAAEQIDGDLADGRDADAMARMASLRTPVDSFFETVKVNDPEPERRTNRLKLLGLLRDTMNRAADFSKIEG